MCIVEIKGKQYSINEGAVVQVDRITDQKGNPLKQGEFFEDIKVLYHSEKGKFQFGRPYLEAIKVSASVVGEKRGPKLTTVRYHSKANSRRKIGHRQKHTLLKIEKITLFSP